MSASGRTARVSLSLAALFHDPPWKPWGISTGRVKSRPPDKSGVGNVILAALEAAAENRAGSKAILDSAREAFKRGRGLEKSHERQALILLGALLGALESRCSGRAASAVRALEEAIDLVAGGNPRVRRADILAAALDRMLLLEALKASGLPGNTPSSNTLWLSNPFNPNLRLGVCDAVEAGVIARFILDYATTVAALVCRACERGEGRIPCDGLLLHVAFLLLEPFWYRVAGLKCAPPADTRLPTHTVFDHVNAALAAVNWVSDSEAPRGCLVIVDLAGVQEWISASRRTRDLWAASWLASFLAWKTVEPLVLEYGPGILVQPPARLHPFYSARIVGEALGRDIEDELENLARGSLDLRWLGEPLGLPLWWPVDPTIPSQALLALPPEACNEATRRRLLDSYRSAWQALLQEALGLVGEACRRAIEASRGEARRALEEACPLSKEDIVEKASRVEPPLAIRVSLYDVGEAWKEARERLGGDLADLAFYSIAIHRLYEAVGEVSLKTSGASGTGYAVLASSLHRIKAGQCTLCGAPALIDGRGVSEALQKPGRPPREAREDLSEVLVEVGGDRLCVYCLVKRFLRTLLIRPREDDLAGRLVGIRVTRRAREKLLWRSVDEYTARRMLAEKELAGLLESTAKELVEVIAKDREASVDLAELMVDSRITLGLTPVKPLVEGGARERLQQSLGEPVLGWLESVTVEVAHDEGALREFKRIIDRLGLREDLRKILEGHLEETRRISQRHRARYALLAMDADNMGKGVLRGVLPASVASSPKDYVARILNLEKGEYVDSVASRIASYLEDTTAYLAELEGAGERGGCSSGGLRLPVTLSYHFTVSRALAAQALADREIVEGYNGMIVYAGGDDLLAVLPAARPRGGSDVEATPIRAAFKARRSYWGAYASTPGFHVVRDSIVVPALAAYGRSGAVLYANVKTPMWSSLDLLRHLEESKDHIARHADLGCGEDCVVECKDVLVIAGEAVGASVLPFKAPSRDPPRPGGFQLLSSHVVVEALTNAIRMRGSKGLSASLLYDAAAYLPPYRRLALQGRPGEALKLIELLLARNSPEGRPFIPLPSYTSPREPRGALEAIANTIFEGISIARESLALSLVRLGVSLEAEELDPQVLEHILALHSLGEGPHGTIYITLLEAILSASRIVRGSM